MCDGFSELPGFTAIKQNGLHIGIEDPDFGGFSNKSLVVVNLHI